jgi:hypothetical protein
MLKEGWREEAYLVPQEHWMVERRPKDYAFSFRPETQRDSWCSVVDDR